jgi:hypothetical protein
MTLEVISGGIYAVEITFNTRFYDEMQKHSWCFEQSKGLVYTMDLSGELPAKMGYKTARIYLRDLLLYLDGKLHTHTWKRSLEDYRLDGANLSSTTK